MHNLGDLLKHPFSDPRFPGLVTDAGDERLRGQTDDAIHSYGQQDGPVLGVGIGRGATAQIGIK